MKKARNSKGLNEFLSNHNIQGSIGIARVKYYIYQRFGGTTFSSIRKPTQNSTFLTHARKLLYNPLLFYFYEIIVLGNIDDMIKSNRQKHKHNV